MMARATGDVTEIMPLADVCLVLAHDGVGDALLGLDVDQHHGGAEHHPLARQLAGVDHLRAGQAVLELAQARLDLALPLLGGVVLRVLGDVAVGSRGLDLAHDARALLRAQAPKLLLEQRVAARGHGNPIHAGLRKRSDARPNNGGRRKRRKANQNGWRAAIPSPTGGLPPRSRSASSSSFYGLMAAAALVWRLGRGWGRCRGRKDPASGVLPLPWRVGSGVAVGAAAGVGLPRVHGTQRGGPRAGQRARRAWWGRSARAGPSRWRPPAASAKSCSSGARSSPASGWLAATLLFARGPLRADAEAAQLGAVRAGGGRAVRGALRADRRPAGARPRPRARERAQSALARFARDASQGSQRRDRRRSRPALRAAARPPAPWSAPASGRARSSARRPRSRAGTARGPPGRRSRAPPGRAKSRRPRAPRAGCRARARSVPRSRRPRACPWRGRAGSGPRRTRSRRPRRPASRGRPGSAQRRETRGLMSAVL